MTASTRCPLCGGHVLYIGALDLECNGATCPNRTKAPASPYLGPEDDIVGRIQAELAQMYGWFAP